MSPGPPREPTDRQLADIVNYLARLCMEAERGLRPPSHLERFMDPSIARRFEGFVTLGRFRGGPVQPADVGPAHVSRQPDGSVIASVVTRTEGRRWGALSFRLKPHEGLWRIADAAKQKGESNCPLCALGTDNNKTRTYLLKEMDADHVTAWSKGGSTDLKNLTMLCQTHNRAKGNR